MVLKTSSCRRSRPTWQRPMLWAALLLAADMRRNGREVYTRCVYQICTSRHSSDWKVPTSGFALYGGRRTTPPERCESSRPPRGRSDND